MTNRFTVPVLLLLVGFCILPARLVAADDKEKKPAATRPAISEEVAPLQAIAPTARDGYKGVGFQRKPLGKSPFPAVVLIHGGFGGNPAELVKNIALGIWPSRYLAAGYVVATITYRKRDADPQSTEAVEDVLAVIEHLRKLPYVDPKSIVLNGNSGGGDLALCVAAATDLAAIVPEEPAAFMFTGIFNKTFPKKGDVYTVADAEPIRADPKKYYTSEYQKLTRERIARIKCPILIIQGDLPKIGASDGRSITGVNQFNAEITIPELRAAGKTLEVKTYPGEPHSFAFFNSPTRTPRPAVAEKAFEDVNAFLQKHLPTKPTPMDPSLVKQVPFDAK
jgi:dipeptidyl aminopeptidase/acylaminoacyl peptidase